MSAQYLQTILRQQTAVISQNSSALQAANTIIPLIRDVLPADIQDQAGFAE